MPVNVAMRLAQKGLKCLLIDLDLQRDAISKVFDIDSDKAGNRAHTDVLSGEIPSCVRNLWVWPASNFGKTDGCQSAINIKELIANLESRYDHLIIYAPNIKLLDSLDQIGCCEELNFFALPGFYSYLPIDSTKYVKFVNKPSVFLSRQTFCVRFKKKKKWSSRKWVT